MIARAYRLFTRFKFKAKQAEKWLKGMADEMPTCLKFLDRILDNPKFVHMLIKKQMYEDRGKSQHEEMQKKIQESYQFWKAKK